MLNELRLERKLVLDRRVYQTYTQLEVARLWIARYYLIAVREEPVAEVRKLLDARLVQVNGAGILLNQLLAGVIERDQLRCVDNE